MKIKLRSYQQDAIDSVDDYFIGQRGSHPLIIAPTASGKSLILGGYIEKQLKLYAGCRFMMVTHQKELIEQNYEKLMQLYPECDAGIYSASVGRKESSNSVVFAGIQSVYNKADQVGKIDVILVDECHMIPKTGNGMYRKFLDAMLEINPLLKVIGLTATPYRLAGGLLYEGKDALFDGVCYDISVKFMLDKGYITPLVTPNSDLGGVIDTSEIPVTNGEFVLFKLEQQVDKDDLVKAAVAEMVKHGQGRKSWLVFATSIKHAEHIADELDDSGILNKVVTGDTPKKDREKILLDFKAGLIQCLVNVNVLTTGFDAPNIDLVAMLRPTQSTSLYIQMLGRGVRLCEDKADCLVLDFAGNIATHGAFDNPEVTGVSLSDGKGQAPTRVCECGKEVHASVRQCPFCGFWFPIEEKPKHEEYVSTLDIISKDKDGQRTYPVAYMTFKLHQKTGVRDTCRVNYHRDSGTVIASDFFAFESEKFYAKERACKFWAAVMPEYELPLTSMNAVVTLHQQATKRITAIVVTTTSKYKQVIRRKLALLG